MPLEWTRRRFLQGTGGLIFLTRCGGLSLDLADDASFDEVLDAIHGTDLEYGGGLSNHAPMAAEALVELGQADRVPTFVKDYASDLETIDAPAPSGTPHNLGDFDARLAWLSTYESDVARMSVAEILARDWPALAPGFVTAGWHGILRTGHAVRSLDRADSPSRRRELAFGLSYLASKHTSLGGSPGSAPEAGLDVRTALGRVAPLPDSKRKTDGLIYDRLLPLRNDPDFAALVASIDLEAQPVGEAISALTAASARAFVNAGGNNIVLLHAITGTSALRLLLPHLGDEHQRLGVGFAFEAVAAAIAAQAEPNDPLRAVTTAPPTIATLQTKVREATEVHTIKLVETVLREHAEAPSDELLVAAAAW